MGELILNVVVLGAVAVATATDLRTRRIPNLLTLPLALVGLALNGAFSGVDGLLASATGWALGCGMLLPLFWLRGMGAGDVKLMAALGALKGPEFVFFTCLWAALAGGVLALYGLLRSHKLGLALSNLYYGVLHAYYFKFDQAGGAGGSLISAGRFPYAPAIAVGAVAVLGGARWLVV